jgi:hypothetical protein
MATNDTGSNAEERRRQRVRLARLEADMAYFQARLEIIGDPVSANQLAQRKVFKLLHSAVSSKLQGAKRQFSELG